MIPGAPKLLDIDLNIGLRFHVFNVWDLLPDQRCAADEFRGLGVSAGAVGEGDSVVPRADALVYGHAEYLRSKTFAASYEDE